jgi:hypothetical protein
MAACAVKFKKLIARATNRVNSIIKQNKCKDRINVTKK